MDCMNDKTPDPTDITTLYIVRHGESLDNAGIPYVRTPEGSCLTERGRRQAHEVARQLARVPAEAVIASNLLRARQTAEIIAHDLGLEVRIIPELYERSIGPFGGRTDLREAYREKFEEYERATNEEKMRWSLGDGWESLEAAQRRFVGAIERIADDYRSKTAIVVTHGTVMRTFLIYVGYGTLDDLVEDVIQNTGYIVIETDGSRFTVKEAVGLRHPAAASSRLEQ